jgi:hypothetical protein
MRYFTLLGHDVVQCSARQWSEEFEESKALWHDVVAPHVRVSTIFLGTETGMGELSEVFETAVFCGSEMVARKRNGSWDEAMNTHRAMRTLVEILCHQESASWRGGRNKRLGNAGRVALNFVELSL